MPDAQLQPVIAALKAGDRTQARALLRPLLKQPTAERWYMAALLSGTPAQAQKALRRALTLDPDHRRARQRLEALESASSAQAQHARISEDDLPPLAALVADDVVIPVERPFDPEPAQAEFFDALRAGPLKKRRIRRRRTRWWYVGVGSMVLFSLSLTYFAMMALGSSLPARLRSLVTGVHPVYDDGAQVVYATPVAVIDGTPYYARPLEEYGSGSANATPVTEIGGTPVYARPDAVVVVAPVKTALLTRKEPISDILEPGFAHEYTFEATRGDELAVGIQFFSPTAQRVGRNVTLLDPDGYSAESICQRDNILQGDNGVVFTCTIHKSGQWKIRLFGREGESSGVYVVAIQAFAEAL